MKMKLKAKDVILILIMVVIVFTVSFRIGWVYCERQGPNSTDMMVSMVILGGVNEELRNIEVLEGKKSHCQLDWQWKIDFLRGPIFIIFTDKKETGRVEIPTREIKNLKAVEKIILTTTQEIAKKYW